MLTCPPDMFFSAAALSGPLESIWDLDEPAGTLRAFLASPPPDYAWPPDGWRRLVRDDERVLFAAASPRGGDGNFAFVDAAASGGSWTVAAYGECWPRVVLEGGLEGGSWEVALVSDSDALDLLVSEFACASGEAAGERVQPPWIVETEDTVTITFGIAPIGWIHDCQGAPATPYRVLLGEPLGRRVLQDGIFFPVRVVERP